MARIRSIHPGLTSDEAYMSMSMVAKAAWTPLWMQCDDHGIFEWKPIVLKAVIFPADNVEFDKVLIELEQLGCVMRIQIAGKPCGIVRNFARYQRPKNPSYRYFKDTPIPEEYGNYIGLKGSATPAHPQPSPSTPEILPQRKEEGGRVEEEIKKEVSRPVAKATRSDEKFEEFWQARPRRKGDDPRKPSEDKFRALVKTGVDPDLMIAGAKAAAIAAKEQGKYGTEFVPQTIKWLRDQRFVDYAAAAFSDRDEAPAIDWEAQILRYQQGFQWNAKWYGAEPGDVGCRAPADLLAKHGYCSVDAPDVPQPSLRSMQ